MQKLILLTILFLALPMSASAEWTVQKSEPSKAGHVTVYAQTENADGYGLRIYRSESDPMVWGVMSVPALNPIDGKRQIMSRVDTHPPANHFCNPEEQQKRMFTYNLPETCKVDPNAVAFVLWVKPTFPPSRGTLAEMLKGKIFTVSYFTESQEKHVVAFDLKGASEAITTAVGGVGGVGE